MTTVDLKSGDIVRHPEHGPGLVARMQDGEGSLVVLHYPEKDVENGLDETSDLTGWERAETVRLVRGIFNGLAQEATQ